MSVAQESFEAARRSVFQPVSASLLSLQYLYASCPREDGNHEQAVSPLKEVVGGEGEDVSWGLRPLNSRAGTRKILQCKGQFDEAIRLLKDVFKAHQMIPDTKLVQDVKTKQELARAYYWQGKV